MPLLGKKIFNLNKPLTLIDHTQSVFVIQHTGECFQSKEEYEKCLRHYNENVWTCQCTGHINLTHEEAWKSEQEAHQMLKKNFPEPLEKPLLEIVHHNTSSLDALIDQAYVKVNSMFFPGELVHFKVKHGGRVVKGCVIAVEIPNEASCHSPCSDKENADGSASNNTDIGARKCAPKLLPYKYNIRLMEEDKIISSVPAEDLARCERPPSKDLLRLFIRGHALRHGTNPNSPWVVDQKLVKQYSLPSKFADFLISPLKATEKDSKGENVRHKVVDKVEDKKRKSSAGPGNVLKKKAKVEVKPVVNQPTLHNYSKSPKRLTSLLKKAPAAADKTTPKKNSSGAAVSNSSDIAASASKDSPIREKNEVATTSRMSPEFDHSYSTPIKKVVQQKLTNGLNSTEKQQKAPKVPSQRPVGRPRLSGTLKSKLEGSAKKAAKAKSVKRLKVNNKLDKATKLKGKVTPSKRKEKDSNKSPTKSKSRAEVTALKNLTDVINQVAMDYKKPLTPKKFATPIKTPTKSLKTTPKKQKLKQMTLFDMKARRFKKSPAKEGVKLGNVKSPAKSPNKLVMVTIDEKVVHRKKGVYTPPQINSLAKKIMTMIKENRRNNINHFIDRMLRNVRPTPEQLKELPDIVRVLVMRRITWLEEKKKTAKMTPEEKEVYLKEKREQKRKEFLEAKQQEKQQAKREKLEKPHKSEKPEKPEKLKEVKLQPAPALVPIVGPRQLREDKDLVKSLPLPIPKLVPTPDNVPNELFGDVVMVVEFINCYSGLLMPGEPYPVQSDLLLKAIGSGKEGFGYMARILLILLQTLLQDQIAEDYKELGVRLSDLPVNIFTTSELVRLCLRKNDDHTDNGTKASEDFDDDEDLPDDILLQLEENEIYELSPQQKLKILAGLCHRIMNSYSVQDYMEQKQKTASQFWKEKLIQCKTKKEQALEEQKKEKDVPADGIKADIKKEDSKEVKAEQGLTITDFYKKVEEPPAPEEAKVDNAIPENEDTENLASVVKRRRVLAKKALEEKEKRQQEEKERREKEAEEQKKVKEKETFEKQFEEAVIAARLTLRQSALGTDRNHTRYWLFCHGTPGLFLEKGWVGECIDYNVAPSTIPTDPMNVVNATETSRGSDSEDEPLAKLKKKKPPVETSVPTCGQNLWFQYDTIKEVDQLVEALCKNGIREVHLRRKLRARYSDVVRAMSLRRSARLELKPSDGDRELLEGFRKELMETEVRVKKGLLGGVPNMDQWESRLQAATSVRHLIPCLLETQGNVLPRFLQGIMAVKKTPVKTDDNSEETEGEKKEEFQSSQLQKWIEAVENCTTLSRLHVLLGVLDACIKWEKSSENAKCKICRKKDDDMVLILCDNCNQAFHLFCLRPALTELPEGDWNCPACQPTSCKQNDRVEKLSRRHADDSDNVPAPLRSGLRPRQAQNKQKRRNRRNSGSDTSDEESSKSGASEEDDDEEEESGSEEHSESEAMSECCLCGGDEDVVSCSKCRLGFHTFCHKPPMHNKPRGNWVCNFCVTGKRPKFIAQARNQWQVWKKRSSQNALSPQKTKLKRSGRNQAKVVQQITSRIRQRISAIDQSNQNGDASDGELPRRQVRAVRRATKQDESR